MNNINRTDKSALSLILYSYQFEVDPPLFEWNDVELSKLKRIYPLDKLMHINRQIEHYLENKDIDLSEILPSTKIGNKEKEALLAHISEGIRVLAKRDLD